MSENRSKQLTLLQYSIYQEKKRSDKTKEQVAMIHDDDELTSFNQSELSDNQELVNDIGKEDESKETRNETLTPAERARHLYPTWVNRPECIGPDNASCFSLSDGGIICRICSFSQNDIPKTRDHYITVKANPTSSNSVLGHVQSDTHKDAVARWIKQHSVLPVQLPVEDTKSLNQHKINQVKAVNFIAHERNACSQFNSTTDLLNSVNNPHFVGRTKISDMALFWSIADSIDLFYLKKIKGEITDRTPLAVMLDTSTDRTSTTVLCVNLKYVHNSRLETVLVGLEEMTAGSTGVQLYTTFKTIMTNASIDISQIVCVTSDGDPAMIGSHKGFVRQLQNEYRHILHHHCSAHRFNLSLKHSFDSPAHPISQLLINNANLLIHSVTKSHQKKKEFTTELARRHLPTRSLSKPLKIRWSTYSVSVSQVLEYHEIICEIHKTETDPRIRELCSFFGKNENILRLEGLNYILKMTAGPLQILQANEMTPHQSQIVVQTLQHHLRSMTAENLTPILLEAVKNQAPEDYADKLHDVALEVLNMRSDLINELNRLFFENDDCTDLNFLPHEFLLLPDSPVTDMAILSAAEKLKRFIPPLLHRHVLTQWKFMMLSGRTSDQIMRTEDRGLVRF